MLMFFSKVPPAFVVTGRDASTAAAINASEVFDFVFILNKMNESLA